MTYLSTNKTSIIARDILLIMEGVSVAVSWYTSLSFSTISDDFSQQFEGSFSYILAVMVGASQSPLMKIWTAMQCHCQKCRSLSCCFEVMDIGSKSVIILLLYLHEVTCISMDICITHLLVYGSLWFHPSIFLFEWLHRWVYGWDHVIWPQPGRCSSLLECQQ